MKLKHHGWKVTVQQVFFSPTYGQQVFGPSDIYTGEGLEKTLKSVLASKKALMKKKVA